jgi:MFS family permease
MSAVPDQRMSPLELRASLSLASLFALRMLGLFLILPVFAVHAHHLKGGDNQTLVGLALGAYGITQALLQLPFGMASDRYGRKRIIVFGLLVFAAGSFIAVGAENIYTVIFARALQGSGAISAAITALAADVTREQHRTKAMAIIGSSIGVVFAASLVAAPALYQLIGMDGIFALTGALSLLAIWITLAGVPPEPHGVVDTSRMVRTASLGQVLRDAQLLRLNFGIFSVHVVQVAIFVVVPVALVTHGGLPLAEHWKVYLPVVIAAFVLMVPPIVYAERHGRTKALFIASIALLLAIETGLALELDHLAVLIALLVGFFVAFNILEASLPSLVSGAAPPASRGTALGVYNTAQSLGVATGGVVGGWLAQHFGQSAVFVFGIAVVALWLVVALDTRIPRKTVTRTF